MFRYAIGMSSQVNHPAHYNTGKIEVIEFLEDQKLDFHCANAVKYVCRAGRKNPDKEAEDLEKAIWYLKRKLAIVEAAKEAKAPPRPNDMNPRETRSYLCKTRPPTPCGCDDRRHA